MILRLHDLVSRALMTLAAFWAFGLAFYILVDVVARNLGVQIDGTAEIAANSIVIIVFMQIAYCIHIRGMLRADMLTSVLPESATKILRLFSAILGALFFAAIVIGTFEPAIESWNVGEWEGPENFRVPVWPARFAVVIGAALAVVSYVLAAVEIFLRSPPPSEQTLSGA
ncbi:MAG: TRAP transporter small permease [Alphaproteobacteria bacterium]